MKGTFFLRNIKLKKISVVLFAIIAFASIGCQLATDEEKVVNIRVHGYVRDKLTNGPLRGCDVAISNGYIKEEDNYAATTDSNGYYDFRRDVWLNYSTIIDVYGPDITYQSSSVEIDNDKDNEVNFLRVKY